MNDTRTRAEISANRPNGDVLIQRPNLFGHNASAVATNIDRGGDFEGLAIQAMKIYKHLHRDANFLPAQKGCVWHLAPSGREDHFGNPMVAAN